MFSRCWNPKDVILGHFYSFSIFFERSRGVNPRKIIKKIVRCIKYLVCRNFRYLSAIYAKWDQKWKRGNQKMRKCVRGLVGCWNHSWFFWPTVSPMQKKNSLEIGLGYIGRKSILSDGDKLFIKWFNTLIELVSFA